MAVNIKKVNSRIFTVDSNPKAKGYRAIANGEFVSIVSDGAQTPNITNRTHFTNLITRSADNTILFDGTNGATVTQLVDSINEIANFSGGSVSVIPDNLIFANAAARDAYFNPSRLDELVTGLEIILEDDGSGGRVLQRWLGLNNPSTYTGAFWHTMGVDALTGEELVALINSVSNVNFADDEESAILSRLSLEPNGDVRSSVSFIFPPGSIIIGDSVLESGGRIVSARSLSTGNLGAFIIQLFTGSTFLPATIYDTSQTISEFNVQITDDTVNSGISETNVRQVVQADIQTSRVTIRPNGALPDIFNFQVRLNESGEPVYDEDVSPSELTDIGGGDYELTFVNPSQIDAGTSTYIRITGIDLKGGNGFDGTDTIRFGDATKNNFFPYLILHSIPIVRLPIASEQYVNERTEGMISLHDFSIAIPSRIDIGTNLEVSRLITFNVTNYSQITSLKLQLNGSDEITLTNPISDGIQTQSVLLSGVDTSVETILVFRLQANASVNSNTDSVQVRNVAQSESFYYGISGSNNPASIDVATLTLKEISETETFQADFDIPDGSWAIILSPNNYSVTSIIERSFNQEIITDFTKVDDVRTIEAQVYDSYVHQNNAGVQGILSTNVTVEV